MRFVSVTKPGIIFGNLITTLGGFLLASKGHIHVWLLITTLFGMTLIVASGCVLNNYIDRDIDQLMERTKNRVLAKGLISTKVVFWYVFLLGLLGSLILYFIVNPLTTLIALLGWFVYVVIYSLYAKRRSQFGTIIGALAGAVPPVVGYCAVANHIDLGAIIVFLILFFWQMPHFYSIAIYRLNDYAAASIPVLPSRKNIHKTKVNILLYVIAFMMAALMPCLLGYTGYLYFIIALAVGLFWLYFAIQGFLTKNTQHWARNMFTLSIINITLLSFIMSF